MQLTEFVGDYEVDKDLGRDLRVWLVIKGFKQLAIVRKVIERKGSKAYGLTAASNTAERKYSDGMIVLTDLKRECFDQTTLESTSRIPCVEPFDIALCEGQIAFTSGYQIVMRELVGSVEKRIANDWMAFLHSVQISSDRKRVLTASAGFDTLLEVNIESGEIVWAWNAWDHGYNYSEIANVYLVKSRAQLPKRLRPGSEVIVVPTPSGWPKEGIPTNQSPTRLNGAHYDENDLILMTCFHRPELFKVRRDGSFTAVNLNLKHPHGFIRSRLLDYDGYLVTNTGAGEFLSLDQQLAVTRRWVFDGLPADSIKKRDFGEWIQNVIPLIPKAGVVAAIDTLRDGTHILDLKQKRRRFIPNPPEWTVQKLVSAA